MSQKIRKIHQLKKKIHRLKKEKQELKMYSEVLLTMLNEEKIKNCVVNERKDN